MWGYGLDDDRDECNAAPGIGGFMHCSCSSCRQKQERINGTYAKDWKDPDEEERYERQRKAKSESYSRRDVEVPVYFVELLRETHKAWLLKFENDRSSWFPKSLCKIDSDNTTITGPYSFMKIKLKEIAMGVNLPQEPVSSTNQEVKLTFPDDLQPIVIVEEPCPYCGSTTSCDCASPGKMTTRILRPHLPSWRSSN